MPRLGRLDVEAAWSEQVDDVLRDLPEDGVDGRPLRPGSGHVGDFALDAGEDDCRTGSADVPRMPNKPPVHELRHELGDTRHRRVRYNAVATTRFREYFPPEIIDGVDADTGERLITHVGAETELRVPSSRRPEPPDILYVIPTFTWSEETVAGLVAPTTATATAGDRRRATTSGWQGRRHRRHAAAFRRLRQGGGLRVSLHDRGSPRATANCSASCSATSRGSRGRSTGSA